MALVKRDGVPRVPTKPKIDLVGAVPAISPHHGGLTYQRHMPGSAAPRQGAQPGGAARSPGAQRYPAWSGYSSLFLLASAITATPAAPSNSAAQNADAPAASPVAGVLDDCLTPVFVEDAPPWSPLPLSAA